MWASIADYVWAGRSAGSQMFRRVLHPVAMVFGAAVAYRNRRYDAQSAPTPTAIPAISIGNLTVGGTGKTPIAAWCVNELRQRGATPAIVMRGVGDDEWRVHEMLNPETPVIVAADRLAGIASATARGADCVVMDDAFQHRRAPRVVDVVLLSADRWSGDVRLLPSGPFREPFTALGRATLVVVTVKAATEANVNSVIEAIARQVAHVPIVVARLVPDRLRLVIPADDLNHHPVYHPVSWLAGRTVHTLCAIGDPAAFETQVRNAGPRLATCHRLGDHHAFSRRDVERVARDAEGADGVVCTLKDAVKLAALWPRNAPPLWYLSQSVVIDRGAEAFARACDQVLAARRPPAVSAN